jgi:RNA polymerase sigma-70 factor (ECF subfamily)
MAHAPQQVEAHGIARLAAPPDEPTDRQLLERFVRRRDEEAFALLVRRHGPLVLGVCQRVLEHQQDAEDAFQATFLVLVRKARSLSRPELLANWLYGVAYRTARKARVAARRRRSHEGRVVTLPAGDPVAALAEGELRAVLDEEIKRLPEKYRAPVLLCDVEGLTHEEAARRLGWPVGSMSSRLARGRELLRDRLAGRCGATPTGVTPLLGVLAVGVPLPLQQATAQGLFTAAAESLAAGLVRAMARQKLRLLLAVVLAVLALAAGTGVAAATVFGWADNGAGCQPPPPR